MPDYGKLKGTLSGIATSITNPFAATGSVSVAVGDLVVAFMAERTAITAGTVTDNLSGTAYTAQNVGTDAGNATGKCYWKIAGTAGTLTSISAVATASSDDVTFVAAVFAGPFNATPLDASPANITTSTTSPEACPATGTLAQAFELVIGWFSMTNGMTASGAVYPALLAIATTSAGEGAANSIGGAILYKVVNSTATSTSSFTTGSNPAQAVNGTLTFKFDVTAAPLPKDQTDWPTPLGAAPPYQQDLRTWLGRTTALIVPPPVKLGGQPVTDLPIQPLDVVSLRTWTFGPSLVARDATRYIPASVTDWGTVPDDREVRSWIAINPALLSPAPQLPLNQYSWPLPPQTDTRLALTWTSSPPLTAPISPKPVNQYSWPLPIRASESAITWTSDPSVVARNAARFIPSLVTDWGTVPDVREVRTWTQSPQLATPAAPTPRNQYNWSVPIGAEYPISLRTTINEGIELQFVSRAPYFAYKAELVPFYAWAPQGNVALLTSKPPITIHRTDTALPILDTPRIYGWTEAPNFAAQIFLKPPIAPQTALPAQALDGAVTWTKSPNYAAQVPPPSSKQTALPVLPVDGAITWTKAPNYAAQVPPPTSRQTALPAQAIDSAITWTQSNFTTTVFPRPLGAVQTTLPPQSLDGATTWTKSPNFAAQIPPPSSRQTALPILDTPQIYGSTFRNPFLPNVPVNQYSWPLPVQETSRVYGFAVGPGANITTPVVLPRNQYDWPLPVQRIVEIVGWIQQSSLSSHVTPVPPRPAGVQQTALPVQPPVPNAVTWYSHPPGASPPPSVVTRIHQLPHIHTTGRLTAR